MENNNREEIEVDLKGLFYCLADKIWILIFAGIICAILAGIITKVFLEPVYESTTKIYVINRQEKNVTTYSDLQIGTQLTKDFEVLVKSRSVTEEVIKKLNLNMTHEALVPCISVSIPVDTRIIEITVKYKDPYMAKKLADAIAQVSSEGMETIMEMEKVNIVESGNIPVTPSSPNFSKNVMLGGMAGVIGAVFILCFLHLLDDTIKSGEDIEKHLDLTILGTLPLDEGIMESRKVKAALRKAYKKGYKGGIRNAVN